MAEVPTQRITGPCSPQRPDETFDDYFDRCKAHRDAWRQQILDDYYKPKDARLPSPNSEEGFNEDEMAQRIALIESEIRIENGLAEPRDLPNPVVWPAVVYPPGKSVSECSEYEPGLYSPIPRGRPEDLEYESQMNWNPIPESTSTRKRSKSPAGDDGLEPPAKRCRLDTTSGIPLAESGASGQKRKRVQFDEPQAAREQEQASPKKRKTDRLRRPSSSSATSSSKRKRAFNPDEACDSEVQPSPSGRRVSEAKRRKVGEENGTRNASVGGECNHTPRLTRARRRQLSGKDAQLFQLGEGGQLDLQVQACETEGQVKEAAAGRSRSRRQRSSATSNTTKTKGSKTGIGANTRATTRISSDAKASAKAAAGSNTGTSAGTKARRGRPKRQLLTNS